MKKSRKIVMRKAGKYEIGRTIGEGTFAKVKFAQNTETGESVAMKVLDKQAILKHKMVDQIKREISVMKLVRHPNIVRLHEFLPVIEVRRMSMQVLASRSKIYIILEFVTGGELFDKIINVAEFSCPPWFSPSAKSLVSKILDPDPQTRIRISEIRKDEWFKKNYSPAKLHEDEDVNLDDVHAVFDDAEEQYVSEQKEREESGPSMMNAFELITLSQGLNLSALFDRRQDSVKRETRFMSKNPANVIIAKMESAARSMGFEVQIRNYKMRIEGPRTNYAGHIVVALEVFEVAPSLFMVEARKALGNTLEYHKFYKAFCAYLGDIIWNPVDVTENSRLQREDGLSPY